MTNVLFSAIQPTGVLTIGNYLGVIKEWIKVQKEKKLYKCIFMIADLHSLTNNKKSNTDNTFNTLSMYLACGINYNYNIIFLQSQVSEHTQLNWILNSFMNVSELKRMIQYKNKRSNYIHNVALLNYPVLMASDILLYNSKYVIVGKDQIQHIELTQKIAMRFNKYYKKNIFNIPKPIFSGSCDKIMSLTSPINKMSKSSEKHNSYISLLDQRSKLKKKIMTAVTDNDNPSRIYYDPIKKPGISNLLKILSNITNINIKVLNIYFYKCNYKDFKQSLFEVIFFILKNIQNRYVFFRRNSSFLKSLLLIGKKRAKYKSYKMMKHIKNIMGILNI